jgi:NAD(P)-dependent dehydrogenase (short-subunit alcohol dehydrogenase family)
MMDSTDAAASSVRDKVVIVTGAASGIGHATCTLFAAQGAKVVVADLNKAGIGMLAESIAKSGGSASAFEFDTSDAAQCERLVQHAVKTFGRIDVLVHAAGICKPRPLLDLSNEEWCQTLRVNLDGTFFLARDVGKVMAAQKSGTMILLTSDRGVFGSIDYAHYAASKGGMIALTKSLALALGKYNVTVNGLNPGMTDTPLARGANPTNWDAKVASDVLGKASMPEEIAQTMLFLAGPGGQYTTGQILGTRIRHGQ